MSEFTAIPPFDAVSPRKVALVSGAGQRIGRVIAEILAVAGYDLAIHCHKSRAEADVLAEYCSALGRRCVVLQADLANPAAWGPLVEAAAQALGPLTLLVNSASIFERDEFDTLDKSHWEAHFSVNLQAPVFLAQAFAAQAPKGSSIVNIVDQRVWKLTPQFFSYTLTKAALWTATQTMAQALAPHIRVNAVGPGPTLANPRQSDADFARQATAIPLERAILPREIAEAVLYLARAGSVTGQMIAVDGGQHLAWRTPDVVGFAE
jgi:NAD(P)-dependent dehydrogenase (short-subunit alcohol dehydrogenase family)